MKNKKNNKKRQVGFGILVTCALLIGTTLSYVAVTTNVLPDTVGDLVEDIFQPEDVDVDTAWQLVETASAVGENTPTGVESGFMSIWWYTYSENPVVDLAVNATDWSTNASSHGYEDTDATTTDTKSELLSYIVVRARFNVTHAKDGANFNGSRCRATLTCSGDETISQTIVGNNSAETYGGGIESDNNSAYAHIYINFYFDDDDDGYRVTDDGSVTWAVKIEAKF